MCPEKVGAVLTAVKNSAEDSPRRASSGHYSRPHVFLIQFYPSRKKRASTADFSYPITLIKPGEIAIGGAGSPLHAASVARPQESSPYNFGRSETDLQNICG
jgi:hypothetical protein